MTREPISEIPRVRRPSRAEFRSRFHKRRRPVVIEGLIDDWPARRWTPAFFRTRYPDLPVHIEVWDTDDDRTSADDYGDHMHHEQTTLGAYVDRIQAHGPSKRYYLVQLPIFRQLPELRQDIRPIGYYSERLKQLVIPELFWMGPAGTVTPTHMDFADNFLVQIMGRKHLILFSPEQSPLLYYPSSLKKWNFSPVDVEKPDLERFPRFAEARPIHLTLEPGETLFIPQGWWHHVRALSPSISLNFWWMPLKQMLRAAPGHLSRLVLHKLGRASSPYDENVAHYG